MQTINQEIGVKLRHIRKHLGWSLLDVHKFSDGNFNIATVGSYERGNRTISLPRFIELCRFYNIPPHVVLQYPRMTCKIMCTHADE